MLLSSYEKRFNILNPLNPGVIIDDNKISISLIDLIDNVYILKNDDTASKLLEEYVYRYAGRKPSLEYLKHEIQLYNDRYPLQKPLEYTLEEINTFCLNEYSRFVATLLRIVSIRYGKEAALAILQNRIEHRGTQSSGCSSINRNLVTTRLTIEDLRAF